MFGTIIAAVDYNHYHVLFDNNEVKECYSNSLRIEAATASLPPDLPPLPQIGTNPKEEPDLDQPEDGKEENLEHLPSHNAGDEEEEAKETVEQAEGGEAEVKQAKDGEPAAGQVEDEQQLPIGHLSRITKANPPNYHKRKRQALGKI